MNLSPAYLKWQEETLQQGRLEGIQEGRLQGIQAGRLEGIQKGIQKDIQEGRLEGQRQMAENFLRVRFGSLDEQLSSAIALMLQLPPPELTRLLFNLSREELLAWFGDVPAPEESLPAPRQEIVENFLRVRFGSLDEQLSSAIALMLQLPSQELTQVLITLSHEQLLERFGESSPDER